MALIPFLHGTVKEIINLGYKFKVVLSDVNGFTYYDNYSDVRGEQEIMIPGEFPYKIGDRLSFIAFPIKYDDHGIAKTWEAEGVKLIK